MNVPVLEPAQPPGARPIGAERRAVEDLLRTRPGSRCRTTPRAGTAPSGPSVPSRVRSTGAEQRRWRAGRRRTPCTACGRWAGRSRNPRSPTRPTGRLRQQHPRSSRERPARSAKQSRPPRQHDGRQRRESPSPIRRTGAGRLEPSDVRGRSARSPRRSSGAKQPDAAGSPPPAPHRRDASAPRARARLRAVLRPRLAQEHDPEGLREARRGQAADQRQRRDDQQAGNAPARSERPSPPRNAPR